MIKGMMILNSIVQDVWFDKLPDTSATKMIGRGYGHTIPIRFKFEDFSFKTLKKLSPNYFDSESKKPSFFALLFNENNLFYDRTVFLREESAEQIESTGVVEYFYTIVLSYPIMCFGIDLVPGEIDNDVLQKIKKLVIKKRFNQNLKND